MGDWRDWNAGSLCKATKLIDEAITVMAHDLNLLIEQGGLRKLD